MTLALCAAAITALLAIWLIARKRRALTGGRVRAHVPGSDSRGSAGGSRHDSSDGVDTALVALALTDDGGHHGGNDSSGHHGGGDHHSCSTAHSCSGSHGCGGGDGGASGGD